MNIHSVFLVFRLDYGKKRGNTKEEKERERLKHKYKKEFKGALREIRKDTRFLAHTKLSDVMRRLVHYRLHTHTVIEVSTCDLRGGFSIIMEAVLIICSVLKKCACL